MPDEDGPLIILAKKLRSLGLPSLTDLIASLEEVNEYRDFVNLVREFLPEREDDILRLGSPPDQMAAFASYFEDRYFPLVPYIREGLAEEYAEITHYIPLIVRGLSYDGYHEITSDWRSGYQLMTYLIQNPYGDDISVSLTEACREYVPVSLLQRVPEGGFSPEELYSLLDNTTYRALGLWAGVIHQDTGNAFLDTDDETYGYNIPLEWDKDVVAWLTEEWHRADLIEGEIWNMAEWLETDIPAHFEELLNFILERRKEVNNETSDQGDKGETSSDRSHGEYSDR